MKRRLFSLALVLMAVGFLAVPSAFATLIEFDISNDDIHKGDSFFVEVWAHDVFDDSVPQNDVLLAFGFDVDISDETIVSLDSWSVGPSFLDFSAAFPNTDVAGLNSHLLDLDLLAATRDADILLATLNLTGLDHGRATLSIVSEDLNEGLIYALSGPQDITSSTDIMVNPEPTSMLLLGTGLLGLAGFRRKFRK